MRERPSLYFLLAVLTPLVFGTLVSERLIERHIVGLARASAEERLDSVAVRLEDRARFVQRCRDTFRDARGLIVGLDDAAITRLLQHIEQGDRPAADVEIGRLIDEVWLA